MSLVKDIIVIRENKGDFDSPELNGNILFFVTMNKKGE